MNMVIRKAVVVLAFLAASMLATVSATRAETVTFPGDGVTLSAELFVPQGQRPFPAVVALHGCSGTRGKNGALAAREADWGLLLAASGFFVLIPDSFASRGMGSQCRTANRSVRASVERIGDAMAAKAYLASRPDVARTAISLMGWSNGATTVLHTIAAARKLQAELPDFARAIAFYPGCRKLAERGVWRARVPLLMLMGKADDWTPFAPCQTLSDRASATGDRVTLIGYADAYHDFDDPKKVVREVRGLAYSADGSGRAHTGTNPAARADAILRVSAFLAR